jgi:hypothetical protein
MTERIGRSFWRCPESTKDCPANDDYHLILSRSIDMQLFFLHLLWTYLILNVNLVQQDATIQDNDDYIFQYFSQYQRWICYQSVWIRIYPHCSFIPWICYFTFDYTHSYFLILLLIYAFYPAYNIHLYMDIPKCVFQRLVHLNASSVMLQHAVHIC